MGSSLDESCSVRAIAMAVRRPGGPLCHSLCSLIESAVCLAVVLGPDETASHGACAMTVVGF
jgi:hypothetical protein